MRSCWSSKLSKVAIFVFVLGIVSESLGQSDSLSNSGYLFPINPGKRALLSGTMGELRSTHFHAGLDIHANVGDPVRAANDGYIYRATVATGGYGTVLYIRHPDGRGTVYAHLSEYAGPIADFVLKERYRRKQSEVDLFFKPGEFVVKKGDIVARSGNTGGSGGPHLHFELRGANEEALNPMVLGYNEVQDKTPPLPQRIAFRTIDIDSRVNDQFGRFEFALQRKGKDYILNTPVNASGRIGLEVLAYDKMENSSFRFGINNIEVFANGTKVFTQKIEKITFGESRNILALVDFRTMETRGYRFNKLYVDDGNRLNFYKGTTLRNGVDINDEDVSVEIKLTDFHNNSTSVFATLKASTPSTTSNFPSNGAIPLTTDITGSVLTLNVNMCAPRDESSLSSGVQIYVDGKMITKAPSYSGRARNVFLIDLNKIQPDSIVTCSGTWVSNFKDRVPSNVAYKYYSDLIDVEFPARSLYDTLFLSAVYDSTFREMFTVGTRAVPLQYSVHMQLKPLKSYTPSRSLGVYRVDHNGYTFMNSYWKNGKIGFNSLSLGQFTLMYDTIAPSARPITMSSQIIRMKIRDELSGISYFEASINGEWLLMTYDYKTGIAYSERLDRTKPMKGDFEMKVVDNAGNEIVYKNKIP